MKVQIYTNRIHKQSYIPWQKMADGLFGITLKLNTIV